MSGDWWAGFVIGAFSGAVAVGIAWMTAVGIDRREDDVDSPPPSAAAVELQWEAPAS